MSNYISKAKIHLNTIQKTGTGYAALHFWAYFLVGCCIYLISADNWLKCNIASRHFQQLHGSLLASVVKIRLWYKSLTIKQ